VAEFRVPTTVRVAGQPFAVRIVPSGEALSRGVSGDTIGHMDSGHQVISLYGPDVLSTACAVDTLLHEVLHAIIAVHAIVLEDDEELVSRLSPALLDTLRANPDLVAALLSDWEVHEHGPED